MERKRTGRLLAAFMVALVATLGLVAGLGSTAYAKVYTTLSVGDVLHVGDTIHSTTVYSPSSGTYLDPNYFPWTLVRCNISTPDPDGLQIVESDSAPYYTFKRRDGSYSVYYEKGFGVWGAFYDVTATSDGIYVEELGEVSDNKQSVTFAVHEPVRVKSVELDQATATLEVGKTATLKATVKPDDAADKSVTWKSSDEKVATVKDGVVTAVAPGKATITATSVNNPKATATCAVTVKGKQMFRLYNPNSGEHFYTSNAAERDNVKNAGWTYEGVGWTAPESGSPVYRLYNEFGGEHHYTTSKGEHDSLVAVGWKDEGVGWYSGGSKPLYRQYNPNAFANNHNYTTSTNERDTLLGLGWRDEGIAWYGL